VQGGDSFHSSDEDLSLGTPGGNRPFSVSVSVCSRRRNALAAFEGFKLLEGAGPIGAEQAREAAVGEDFAAGLAGGAIVGFIVGITDALNGVATTRTGLAEAAVNSHLGTKCRDALRESFSGLGGEPCDPKFQCEARGVEEALPLVGRELVRERDGRETGGVENLVGVGVAHTADEARIGEGALEGAVLLSERGAESFEIGGEDFDSAGIDVVECLLAAQEMERGAALGAGFSEGERAGGKVEGEEGLAAGEFGVRRPPVETAGNHEMDDQPE